MDRKIVTAWLQLKAVTEDPPEADAPRILTGIASTPNPDRAGDVIDSEGARYTLPIPLLAYHDASKPVGNVVAATVTSTGIEIRAELPPASAGIARVDAIWRDIKAKLIRGFSVGILPLEFSFMKEGGIHIKTWDWAELSVVTLPMNQDAVLTVRSLDGAESTYAYQAPPNFPHRQKARAALARMQADLIAPLSRQ